MKKLITIVSVLFAISTLNAAYRISYSIYDFFDKNGDPLSDDGVMALVVGLEESSFTNLNVKASDILTKGNWYNGDASTGLYVLGFTNISVDSMADGFVNVEFSDLSALGFEKGDEIGLIAINQSDDAILESFVVTADAYYTVFAPSMNNGDCGNSASDPWSLITGGAVINIGAITNNYPEDGGSLPTSFLTLSQTVTVVPEPSTYAVIFGAIALGFVAYRRRK